MFLLCGAAASAKPYAAEGFVTLAPSPYDTFAEYVLRAEPDGAILVALSDPSRLIQLQTLTRQRVAGDPAANRIANDLALVIVRDVQPAGWSHPESRLCTPSSFASWSGCAISLYPSLADEPLPRGPTFSFGYPPPPDSDGDGVPDYSDAFPNDPAETTDTDQDGVGNNADPDDDNDGMPDKYEEANGLNPLVDDARHDLDRDGMSNLDEFFAGTRADDSRSIFRLDSVSTIRGQVRLVFQSVPGRFYVVHGSEHPDIRYEPVTDPIRARAEQTEAALPMDAKFPVRFFRILVLPP